MTADSLTMVKKIGFVTTLILSGLLRTPLSSAEINTQGSDHVSDLYPELRGKYLYLSWSLLNPSSEVRGFKVSWNDGSGEKNMLFVKPETYLAYPNNATCHSKFNVTVSPYNVDFRAIGVNRTKSFAWEDIFIIKLSQKSGKVHAEYKLQCKNRSKVLLYNFNWQINGTSQKEPCSVPSAGGKPDKKVRCTSVDMHACYQQSLTVTLTHSHSVVGVSSSVIFPAYDMSIEKLGSHSVMLAWQTPPGLCNVIGYHLSFSGVRRWGDHTSSDGTLYIPVKPEHTIPHESHLYQVIDNLLPYSDYQMCLVAELSFGSGKHSCISLQTQEAESGKPSLLTLISSNGTDLEVNWKMPTKNNGLLQYYTIRLRNGSSELYSSNTTDQSIVLKDLDPCVSYTIVVTATNGAGEGEKAQKMTALGNGCFNSASPTESTKRETKDPTLSTTVNFAMVNQSSSTHPSEVSSTNDPPTEYKLLAIAAAGLSTVLLVILVCIIMKWRSSCQDFKKCIGLSCTKFQAEKSAVESRMAPLPELNSWEMRTLHASRTSMAESLAGHTYCYPNITPQVREEIIGIVHRNDNGFQVEEEETSPLYPTRNREVISVEANVGACNSDHIIMQRKSKEALEAVKLLASLRIRESSELSRNELEVGTQEYSEPQAEKLGEAIRLLDDFLSMGGNSNDLSEIVGRPPSMTDSLAGHGYCYPNLSREVIDQILSDAKMQQNMKRNRRRKKC